MRVLILADERQKEGGNNEIIKHMINALYDHKIHVKYINIEEYFRGIFQEDGRIYLESSIYLKYLLLTSQGLI
jgi:hypothetical protein